MQYIVIIIVSIILLGLIILSLVLKNFLSRNKNNNIISCGLSDAEELECGCKNVENCFNRNV